MRLSISTVQQIGKTILDVFVQNLPMWLLERVVSVDKISVFYHIVSRELKPHIKHLYSYKSPGAFELDIEYLTHTYPPIPVEEMAGSGNHLGAVRQPAFLVSFDDGLRECFDFALPILRKHQVHAIFFVCPNFLDNRHLFYRHKVSLCIEALNHADPIERRNILTVLGEACKQSFIEDNDFVVWIKGLSIPGEKMVDMICELCGVDFAVFLEEHRPYMTTEQIKVLANEGHVIGAHTSNHRYLGGLTDVNQIEAEIVDSCKAIAEITHADRVPFAFPFSSGNLDSNVLESIRVRHPIVGEFFDSRGFCHDRGIIQNRLCLDSPSSIEGVSNIPFLMERALRNELSRRLRSQIRRMLPILGRVPLCTRSDQIARSSL